MFGVASGSLQAAVLFSVAAMTVVLVTSVIARHLVNKRRAFSPNSAKVNRSLALHGQAALQLALANFPSREQFARDVWAWLHRKRGTSPQSLQTAISRLLAGAALAVYDEEVPKDLPRFVEPGALGFPGYERKIKAIVTKCSNPEGYYNSLVEAVGLSLLAFEVMTSRRLAHVSLAGVFVAPLSQLVSDLPAVLQTSFVAPHRRIPNLPTEAPDTTTNVIARLRRLGTLLAKLGDAEVSFSPPDWARLGHHWIVAQAARRRRDVLSAMIAADIKRALRGEASVVVIDASGELTQEIARLKVFARGQPLHEKLMLIEPDGMDAPAFSLLRALRAAPKPHQRDLHLDLAQFSLTSLFGPGLSGLQRAIIRHAAELLLALPDPSLSDVQDMLKPGGAARFQAHFHKLSPAARAFFARDREAEDMMSPQADLRARLNNATSDPQFSALFCGAEDRFDLVDQITRAKVVIVNASQLSRYAEPFIRFSIAVALIALSRRSAPEVFSAPVFFYVEDVCRYFAQERELNRLFDVASANDIGFVFSTAAIGRIPPSLREALADVSVIMATQLTADDASCLAHTMHASPQDLFSLAREAWLISVPGQGNRSRPLTARLLDRRLERMSEVEFAALRTEMQSRCVIQRRQLQHDPNYDLCWMATISPRTAKRGGKLKVDNLLLTIVAGTTDGTVLRVKGRGVPKPDRTRGNLYITVNVPQPPARRSMRPPA